MKKALGIGTLSFANDECSFSSARSHPLYELTLWQMQTRNIHTVFRPTVYISETSEPFQAVLGESNIL